MGPMTEGELTGRVALVTGGAGAIGRAIGARLARLGAIVVLADLDPTAAERAARELGGPPDLGAGLGVDVADLPSVGRLVERVLERFGRLDVVVNNAGLNRHGSNADQSEADWDAVLAVNLKGAFNVCQAAIPTLQQQRSGRIVNLASRVWVSGSLPAYTASKAGLVGLTRSLARELGPWNVTANAVAPSLVATPFTRAGRSEEEFAAIAARAINQTPLGRLATPEDVAVAVAFFASPDAAFITGEVLHVCGGAQLAPA